jgi:hypothetical protein
VKAVLCDSSFVRFTCRNEVRRWGSRHPEHLHEEMVNLIGVFFAFIFVKEEDLSIYLLASYWIYQAALLYQTSKIIQAEQSIQFFLQRKHSDTSLCICDGWWWWVPSGNEWQFTVIAIFTKLVSLFCNASWKAVQNALCLYDNI